MRAGRTLVGAWIETSLLRHIFSLRPVAPLWVRGLKLHIRPCRKILDSRTLVGAWIETSLVRQYIQLQACRTLVGAWIETKATQSNLYSTLVAPLWVRGLKLFVCAYSDGDKYVAPLWVRGLKQGFFLKKSNFSRSHPCGCVD